MTVIDCRFRPHTEHILKGLAESPIFRDGLLAMGINLDEFVNTSDSITNICKELRDEGFEKALLVGRDAETTYGFPSNNDEMQKFIEAGGDLFLAFAGLDPHKGMKAVKELRYRIAQGFCGAAIDPIYNKLPINHAKFYPVYTTCCELDVPIIITTGPARYTLGTVADFAHPTQIDCIANDFPELRILVSHGAWPFINEMIGVAFRNKNIYLECSEYETFPGSSAFLEAAVGILKDKVVFASAHPFVHYRQAVAFYQSLNFESEVYDKIMFKNARNFLQLT